MNLETLLPWEPETEINGKPVRIGKPNDGFWSAWKADKEGLKALGVSVYPKAGEFLAYWWLRPSLDGGPGVKNASESHIQTKKQALAVPLPTGIVAKLRPWQVELVQLQNFGLSKWGVFLNSSGLGSGKTYQALATASIAGRKVLAICRKSAIPAWQEVGRYFGYDRNTLLAVNREAIRTGKSGLGKWGDDGFEWTLPPNFLLVFDEVHNDAGIDTQNSKMLIAAVAQKLPVLMLSGTAADEPLKMRALGYALGLHNLKDFYAWLFRNGVTKGNYGFEFSCGIPWAARMGIGGEAKWRAAQQKVMGKIHDRLKSEGRIVRISTKDIPGFPVVSVVPVALDFDTPEIQRAYDEMEAELTDLRNKTNKDQTELEIIIRARQRIELLKVPGFVGQIEEALAEGYSVPVFFNFKASVKALGERLCAKGIRFGTFTGDNLKTRETDRADFQSDYFRVLIANLAAGSESINLHDLRGEYPRKSLINPSFNPVHMAQAIGRTGRDGALSPALIEIVFAAGTVEENAYHACQRRIERYSVFNGDFTVEDLTAGLKI